MQVNRVELRDFRCYARADLQLGPGLTVLHGANSAGKTNLLEAIYFGCAGRSCRTTNEREVVRFGAQAARVVVHAGTRDDPHELSVGLAPGEPKRLRADGAVVERLIDVEARPLVSVFMPARLELVKGPPGLRRAHVDQLVAGLWPLRAATRRGYASVLAQRNALLSAIRAGRASPATLDAWDGELARHAVALAADRAAALELVAAGFAEQAAVLGLGDEISLSYRRRSSAATAVEFLLELQARRAADLERGFGVHGPHRDDLALTRGGRDLRVYGSAGEQRTALLALLLAECETLERERGRAPLMLLDDVMGELDGERRARLADTLSASGGQSVITTTDLDHVPGAREAAVTRVHVVDGTILQEAIAA